MSIRKYVDGLQIIDDMTEAWGENLEGLNLSEKLWLIRDGIGADCNFELASEEGLDPTIAEAFEAMSDAPKDFKIKVVFGFCQYLTEEYQPLSHYLSDRRYTGWINAAMETWGDRLQDIPENDGLIFIFNMANDSIDFNDLPDIASLQHCLKDLQKYDDDTVGTVIAAIATIMYDSYREAPNKIKR